MNATAPMHKLMRQALTSQEPSDSDIQVSKKSKKVPLTKLTHNNPE